jgi:hypothetical protein
MAGFEDFGTEDWRETLAELRLMVVGAGFSDWDAGAAGALEDNDDEYRDPRRQLQRYAEGFVSFLKVRSEWNLARMQEQLGQILRDADDRPVTEAIVEGDHEGELNDILGGPTSDDLMDGMIAFLNAMNGDPPAGYFDDPEEEV